MWLHLFPWESKQSRRLIEWACPWHTPNSKIFISFWHSLKSPSGTKGIPYSSCTWLATRIPLPLSLCGFSCLSVTAVTQTCNAASSRTHWCWPHAGRTDTDRSPHLGLKSMVPWLWTCARPFFPLSWVFVTWAWAFRGVSVPTCEQVRAGRDHYLACLVKPSWRQWGHFNYWLK